MEIAAIQTHGLTRRFGALTAVEDVTFSVAPGQFFGFLGPNGAGKSTTIKMLTGLLEPSAGTIEILGQPFRRGGARVEAADRRGAGRHGAAGPADGAGVSALCGPHVWAGPRDDQPPHRGVARVHAAGRREQKLVTDFSHGMQKKLALAAAVIHGPKVLFLDEPFEGVDAIAAGMLKAMLQGMIQRGATIFLTTHVLEIVERLCSHVAIIHQGRLVANGSIDELRAGVASTVPGAESGQRLTLEEIFLSIVGAGGGEPVQELSWLT